MKRAVTIPVTILAACLAFSLFINRETATFLDIVTEVGKKLN